MHIPDEKSLPIAAAATTHKATAVCDPDRQAKQANQADTRPPPNRDAGKHRIQHSEAQCDFQPEAAGSAS